MFTGEIGRPERDCQCRLLSAVLSDTPRNTPDRQETRFMPFTALHADLGRLDATLPDLGHKLDWGG
ncbi:hypothetical protein ACIO6T_43515 [Streptomyces sp. NPDC087532]|uniref:hypothetical protein n=1 Tax=Streptomyces sp. NPDC087532 TaxID=3365795 RepID=UPI0037F5191D